jgi:hypothetical protein
VPGCALSVQPVVIVTALPSGGAATVALSVPDSMALVGFVMYQQMIVAEFGSGGTLSGFTGSNGLTLTVGTF